MRLKGSVQGLDLRPVARCRIAASVPSRGDLFGPACGTHFARVIIDVTSLRGYCHTFASHNVVLGSAQEVPRVSWALTHSRLVQGSVNVGDKSLVTKVLTHTAIKKNMSSRLQRPDSTSLQIISATFSAKA
jgi:hypothetical protein